MLHNSLKKSYIGFIVLITLVLLSGCISKKQNDIHHKELKSGTRFIVKMIPSKDPKTGKKKIIDNETIQSVKKVLFSRIRESGIESISIKKQEDEKLLITIPRESDTEMVRYLIEKVGSFQIRQQVATKKGKPIKWKTVMNKSAIKKATFERIKSRPVINVVLKDSFKKKFAEITDRNLGKTIGIFLDGDLIDSPAVAQPVYTGKFIVSGGKMNFEKSQKVAILLNTASLPIKLKILKIVTSEGIIPESPSPTPTGKKKVMK